MAMVAERTAPIGWSTMSALITATSTRSKPCLGNTHTSSFGSSPTFAQRACGLLPWRAMAGFLLLTLAVALSAPAHAATLATNLDTLLTYQDGYFLHAVEVSDYDHEFAPVGIAQKFSTGSNASGYTLSSMTICMVWFDSVRSVPKVSIYTEGSDGNPGTSKYVLTNPTLKHAGYGADFTSWRMTSPVCDPDGLNSFIRPERLECGSRSTARYARTILSFSRMMARRRPVSVAEEPTVPTLNMAYREGPIGLRQIQRAYDYGASG